MNQDALERIAVALERMAPTDAAPCPADAPAYRWDGEALRPVLSFAPLDLVLLSGIDAQRDALLTNTERFASQTGAHDALLWGARGSGKSALVKACVAAVQAQGKPLSLIEVAADSLPSLPPLFDTIADWARPAIIYLDDLGFDEGLAPARALRSVLEGGVAARPAHVRVYATANRRQIVPRQFAPEASATNPHDATDDQLALADRFGLSLGFHAADQDQYLAMVTGYAAHLGLPFEREDALLWARQRGSRSGRVAWHYAVELAGRAGKRLK